MVHEVAEQAMLERTMADLKPAILLLDLALPRLGRVAGVPTVQQLSPETKIVLLTDAPDEREGISALKAGARGYCNKNIDSPGLIVKAVETVQNGEIWVGRKVVSHLLEELAARTKRGQKGSPPKWESRLDSLTPREREVAHLIGDGATNKEIASRLNVTQRTVKAHLTAVFRKLGISNRLQLALLLARDTQVPR